MGPFQRRALIRLARTAIHGASRSIRPWFAAFGVCLAVPAWAAPPLVEIQAEVGTPFSGVTASVAVVDFVSLGPRVDIVEGIALRSGIQASFFWLEGDGLRFRTELLLGRTFGFTSVDSWDAVAVQDVAIQVYENVDLALRAGIMGYRAEQMDQRGVLATAGVRLWRHLGQMLDLGFEVGWMGNPSSHRPYGGVLLVFGR